MQLIILCCVVLLLASSMIYYCDRNEWTQECLDGKYSSLFLFFDFVLSQLLPGTRRRNKGICSLEEKEKRIRFKMLVCDRANTTGWNQ